ncbi:hypothetical protein N6H05_23770 [Sphingobium sp. WTD-1]|uniref:hypothetical protein n=1 Tax=Sphingobium sp. WTD-1 TaxID=2979467 RepID=UPI0024DE85CA|nr:hypothetical protein [Sphingobium sp. WTD-1]WIA55998.1 hypothetical protein N6H05_23770 [Sphingobium sp. WTD-1]
MSDDDVQRLSYDLWAAKITRQRGIAPPPYISKKPLPAGSKPIGHWIAQNVADDNFNDVLLDLADMTDERRDSLYWTPDAGESGDMNRRFIWAIGPKDDPIGWAAELIGDEATDPILSDPDIMTYNDEDEK